MIMSRNITTRRRRLSNASCASKKAAVAPRLNAADSWFGPKPPITLQEPRYEDLDFSPRLHADLVEKFRSIQLYLFSEANRTRIQLLFCLEQDDGDPIPPFQYLPGDRRKTPTSRKIAPVDHQVQQIGR